VGAVVAGGVAGGVVTNGGVIGAVIIILKVWPVGCIAASIAALLSRNL